MHPTNWIVGRGGYNLRGLQTAPFWQGRLRSALISKINDAMRQTHYAKGENERKRDFQELRFKSDCKPSRRLDSSKCRPSMSMTKTCRTKFVFLFYLAAPRGQTLLATQQKAQALFSYRG